MRNHPLYPKSSQGQQSQIWPEQISYDQKSRLLTIICSDGQTWTLPAETLRVLSPSAETQGHGANPPPPPRHKEDIDILQIDQVGNYAIRLHFSDGYAQGVYSWTFLAELNANQTELMKAYREYAASSTIN